MIKRNIIVLSILLILSVICASAVLNMGLKPYNSVNRETGGIKILPAAEGLLPDENKTTIGKNNEEQAAKDIRTESIPVLNNSQEIDLSAKLCENSSKETSLEFKFKSNGLYINKEIGSDKIPELEGTLEKRHAETGSAVKNVRLNSRYAKAYIAVEGGIYGTDADSAVYIYNLKDFSLTKLASGMGYFSDMAFSGDSNYAAFTYSAGYDEKNSFLQVADCRTDRLKVDRSKYEDGTFLGNQTGLKYSYAFVKWFTPSILELSEGCYENDAAGSEKHLSVLYNIEKNNFVNPDGSVTEENGVAGSPGGLLASGSGPVKAIKTFYEYLSKDQYTKAYDLLDDAFRLDASKGFGISGLKKSDIKAGEFQVYGSILKMTELDDIVSEKTARDTSEIYFYITLSPGKGSDARKPMKASLKKSDEGWKIVSVNDGNPLESPFKQQ